MSPRPIIIDTDPGQDDAVALLLALASPEELEVRAVTSVAGNVPLELTTENALSIVELASRDDVPVFAGCARPMVKELFTAEYVHGATGLDGAKLPKTTRSVAEGHAIDAIIEILRASDDAGVTLCVLGPLTNVAMAMVKAPDIVGSIRELVLMGGGFFEGGNVTPAAEFNIYVDPHAAHVVFTSGVPLVMMPLDVTHKALATPARVKAFADLGTTPGDVVAGMIEFSKRHDLEKYGGAGAPLHDPSVIAYLLEPDIYGGRRCRVDIETAPGPTQGMTLVDWWGTTDGEPNAMVINEVDHERFFRLLVERVARL
jgi:purine nucleosidase